MRRAGMLFHTFDLQRRFLVSPGQRVIVGRHPPHEPHNVRIPRVTVSRQHVQISGAGGGYIVEDAGSAGGATVNGERVAGVVPVGPGDRIDLSSDCALAVRRPWAGESLADLLTAGPLGMEAGVIMARDVLNELMPSYFAGVAHGTIDPNHVLRGDDGRWIVLAHGWTVLDDDGHLRGNPLYVAPEVASHSRLSPAADLYSLGLLTFEAMSGRRPFGDQDPPQVQLAKLFGAAPTWDPPWPEWLRHFFLHLFAVDPSHRIDHIQALAKLDRLADDFHRPDDRPRR